MSYNRAITRSTLPSSTVKNSIMFTNAIGFCATENDRVPVVALFRPEATYFLNPAFTERSHGTFQASFPSKVLWVPRTRPQGGTPDTLVWYRADHVATH